MDTPERSKVGGTPISKIEDSPVFNFINSLSPIQPVKSVNSIHTFHSPGSATISSVFSSPHVSLHKESRFLIRNTFTDLVKQDTSSDLLDECNIPPEVPIGVVLSTSSVLVDESSNITCSLNRAIVDPADENSTQPNFNESLDFENGCPNHNTAPFFGIELDVSCALSEQVQFVQDVPVDTENSHSTEIGLEVKFSADQVKEEASGSDWENLISDNTDGLLFFDPTSDFETCKIQGKGNGTQPNASFDICLYSDSRDSFVDDDGGTDEQHVTGHTLNLLPNICQEQGNSNEQNQKTVADLDDCSSLSSSLGCKLDSRQHRGVRRRCLVFEVAGVSKKNLHKDLNVPTSIKSPINAKPTSDNEQLIASKASKTPVSFVLPGIGLHLNALARTSKDKPITHKSKAPEREFISRPCSMRPCAPATVREKQSQKAIDLQQCQDSENEFQDNQIVIFDASLTPTLGIEESASPKKKRRKAENSADNESCRRCNCKKSKCLKLYCECFAAGVYCVEPCSCQGCLNKPVHEETVLATRKQIESRNPLAFAPKVIRIAEHDQEMGEELNKTPASARHKRGCNCKKSNCLKKYCECYQGGVGCSFSCRCEGCKNAFGRKDGSKEIEYEEELDACEKETVKPDDGKAVAIVPKTEHIQLSETPLPVTPLRACRPYLKSSSLSSGKPPRSSSLSTMNRLENQQADSKVQENVQLHTDLDVLEDLSVDSPPCSAVKTASPNGKRVSPPLSGFVVSPNLKGGRKLILKSVPSFPSLTGVPPSSTQFNSSILS
ncbi:Protein tesmin/TSO1-like CXC 2 [Platanthera zijinensis]|uniref:Protein tesmin/TSO1-like CXC 2 n=1 Tax=Platanthera zijinensis TaxID=2320716 RepID=A0AAP0BZM4_9ASPA